MEKQQRTLRPTWRQWRWMGISDPAGPRA